MLVLGAASIFLISTLDSGTEEIDLGLAPTTIDDEDASELTGSDPAPSEGLDGDQPIKPGGLVAADEPEAVVIAENALYVDAERGIGDNPGTADAPFRRPIEAFSVVEPGQTIYLREGVYTDELHGSNILRRAGTPDAWITIQPYPGERVEVVAGGEWGNGFEFLGSSYVHLSGFVITGRDDSIHGSGVFGKDNAHDIIVSDNYIQGFGGAGVSFVRSSRITVERNEVRDNAARSFYQGSGINLFEATGPLNEGTYSNIVRGNYVVGNYNGVLSRTGMLTDGNCIIIDYFNEVNYQGSTLVENNVCVENGGRGIHVFNSSNVLARNNTLVGNVRSNGLNGGKGEMIAADGTNIVFQNNLVLNNEGIASYVQTGADDAVFINNYVASDPPEGEGNTVLPAGRRVLISRSGASAIDKLRPVYQSPVSAAARADLQPEIDALGLPRPLQGAVGALEPVLSIENP